MHIHLCQLRQFDTKGQVKLEKWGIFPYRAVKQKLHSIKTTKTNLCLHNPSIEPLAAKLETWLIRMFAQSLRVILIL